MTKPLIILWFRNDLRLSDHRALTAAVATGAPVIPLYVLDDETPGRWRMGGASRWWLHMSLTALADDLAARGSRLVLRSGDTRNVVPELVRETGASAVYFSRAYEPFATALEMELKALFDARGIGFRRFGGALLKEPEEVRAKSGSPYKVFTPFWRAFSAGFSPAAALPAPDTISAPAEWPRSEPLKSLGLLPAGPDWAAGLRATWTPGEQGALKRLDYFLSSSVKDYAENRNRPSLDGTSRLSPHLHFGEITPGLCWLRAHEAAARSAGAGKGCETFLKELVWREFSYTLLFQQPELPDRPLRGEFARFPWKDAPEHLKAWQRGRTGYPIVDAGMRELWQTGYMHNRVRMITASFLIKHLLVPWQKGEAWFWDTLVDADLASNAASWQWVAGSGADAAPYFRIFNPVTQGETFDPQGHYVRRFVPEVAALPDAYIHAPWKAPTGVLMRAGIELGTTYPRPIVDHAAARARALGAYEHLKGSAGA